MSEKRIEYTARTDATPQAELSALAAVFKFVLTKKEAASAKSRPHDARKESENVSRYTDSTR